MSIRKPAVVSLLLCLAAAGWLAADPAEPEAPPIMNEAEDLIAARERIGKELIIVVADSDRPVPERHEAATLLGQLQYPPAIDALIQHVDLVDPASEVSEVRIDLARPIPLALADYGNAATPQIVDAYLAERDQGRRHLLYFAIQRGNTADVALRYLRGGEPPDGDDNEARLKRQNMQELERRLEQLAR